MKEFSVFLNHLGDSNLVGTLAKKDQRIFFEYDSRFIKQNISISPYSMPLQPELREFKNHSYSDIFGAINDSLPDGWGLLLMDRYLKQLGQNFKGLTSFERLSYIARQGMGALEFSPSGFAIDRKQEEINLYEMSKNAIDIFEGHSDYVISKLAKAGGSPGGARPKIIVTEKASGKFVTDEGVYDEDDQHWLIKFDVSKEFKNFSKVEYAYSLLAKSCAIEMPETKLFKDQKGNEYFGIKRFDRSDAFKVHTHTFGSLVESNFRIPDQDYKNLILVAIDLTKDVKEAYKIFRLMVFNHLVTNQDDHVKNFSFIMDANFRWKFAPAYDLTPSFGMNNWQSMTINNKGVNILESDYLEVIQGSGLDKKICLSIIEEVKEGVSAFNTLDLDLENSDRKRLIDDYIRIK